MIQQAKTIWVICGPTASGKTAMAIRLAQRLSTEILSADSRQIFRELNIGVARPDPEELAAVKHHFIASHSIENEYSAGQFAIEAREFATNFLEHHSHLVVCGGTGLYLKAFLQGLDRKPARKDLRKELLRRLEEEGLAALAAGLNIKNPILAAKTDQNNPHRVIRALELSEAEEENLPSPVKALPDNWKVLKFAPDLPREELYARINRRTDEMLQLGLWEEASGLFGKKELNALQTVGYREIFDSLEGKISREEAIEKIRQHTRNYAKRQLTWFRRDAEIKWLKEGENPEE